MPKVVKYSAVGLAGVIALLAVWGFIEPRNLNPETETATIPGLPFDWEGKHIGQISDLQIGMWAGNPGTAHRSIDY